MTLLAALLGVRAVLLEPNATPGFTNRVLKPFVRAAACAYEEARRYFGAKGVITGNPVRGGFAALPAKPHRDAARRCSPSAAARARACSTRRSSPPCRSCRRPARLRIVHQTGPAMRDDASRAAYARRGARGRGRAVPRRHGAALREADLVLSRSGRDHLRRADGRRQGRAAGAVRRGGRRPPAHERAGARRGRGARACSRRRTSAGESLAAAVAALVDAPGGDRRDGAGGPRAWAGPTPRHASPTCSSAARSGGAPCLGSTSTSTSSASAAPG